MEGHTTDVTGTEKRLFGGEGCGRAGSERNALGAV